MTEKIHGEIFSTQFRAVLVMREVKGEIIILKPTNICASDILKRTQCTSFQQELCKYFYLLNYLQRAIYILIQHLLKKSKKKIKKFSKLSFFKIPYRPMFVYNT